MYIRNLRFTKVIHRVIIKVTAGPIHNVNSDGGLLAEFGKFSFVQLSDKLNRSG